jgi:hypothetical protein
VIGVVPSATSTLAVGEAAAMIQEQLGAAFPGKAAVAVPLAAENQPGPAPGVLPALLEGAIGADARACALVEPLPRPDPGWIRLLLGPIVEERADVVSPAYARGRMDGLLNVGIAAPLTRALFGRRLRQPLVREIALSRPAAERLLADPEWRTDPGRAGAEMWVVAKIALPGLRVCEAYLGPRPPPTGPVPDVPEALAGLCSTIFEEMEAHASRWQRVRGSEPVAIVGEQFLPIEPPGVPDAAPLVAAFALGRVELRSFWSEVLPPQTVLGLQRLRTDPAESFRFPDPLWARVVYDFMIAWHGKLVDRAQLLRTMAPLYLGWAASWIAEVAPVDAAAADERLERLCGAFEAEKRYLISRWRWPDRFLP